IDATARRTIRALGACFGFIDDERKFATEITEDTGTTLCARCPLCLTRAKQREKARHGAHSATSRCPPCPPWRKTVLLVEQREHGNVAALAIVLQVRG